MLCAVARMFWLAIMPLICGYQCALGVFVCCYSFFCYNITNGYQGVAMWMPRCLSGFGCVATVRGCYSVLNGCRGVAMQF